MKQARRRTVRLGKDSPSTKGSKARVYGFTVHDIAAAVLDRKVDPRSVSAMVSRMKLDPTDLGALVDWLAARRGWISKGEVVPAVLQVVEDFPRFVNDRLKGRGLDIPVLEGPPVIPPPIDQP